MTFQWHSAFAKTPQLPPTLLSHRLHRNLTATVSFLHSSAICSHQCPHLEAYSVHTSRGHNSVATHLEGPQFSDLIAECKEIIAGLVKMLESKAVKAVDNPESEPELKVLDETESEAESEILKSEPELDLEVVEESDSGPTVEESLFVTHVDLSMELVMELSSSSSAMRIHLSLRPPDVYDPLQVFLHEAVSQEFGVLVCDSIYSGADLSCFATSILLQLPLIVTDLPRKSIPFSLSWLRLDVSVPLSRPPP